MNFSIHRLLACLTAALSLGIYVPISAAELGKSQTLISPDQVPDGLSATDWQSIHSTYAAGQITQAASVTSQQAYLKASNTGIDDNFGCSVAVFDNTVVIGSYREQSSTNGVNSVPNEAGDRSGAAYVFVRNNGVWSQQAYLKASNTGAEDRFGVSVAIWGDIIVVGAEEEDSNASGVNGNQIDNSLSSSGAAYVFIRSGGMWSQQAYLKASNTETEDNFGTSVAVSGNTIVVGASGESSNAVGMNGNQIDNSSSNSGAAYVFVRNNSTWTQQAYLKASNTGAGHSFGRSIGISEGVIVVGADGEKSNAVGINASAVAQANNSAHNAGAAYIFAQSNGRWSQLAYLKPSNTGAEDRFGRSVAISGDTVVVGAIYEDSITTGVNSIPNDAGMENESGAAYVFVRSGNTWTQQAYLKASNTGNDDLFGASVSISRDTIAVGADEESSNAVGINDPTGQADNSAYEAGAAYIFKRSNGIWKQYAYLKSSDTDARDHFGYSVAVSGSTVITGIYGEDSITSGINSIPNDAGTADDSGAAYIFTLPEVVPPAVVKFTVTAKVNQPKFGKVTGAGRFNAASRVTLKATAAKGHTFIGWYEKKKLISKGRVLVIKNLKANRLIIGNFK